VNTSKETAKRQIWELWASKLHVLGLRELFASLLEASSPLHLIAAQLVYISEPVVQGSPIKQHFDALAPILGEPHETKAFIAYLRESVS
jgi:hypothetical protein